MITVCTFFPNIINHINDNTDFTECDDKFYEDSSCCNSCGSTDCISIDDHLNYLNITMGSDGC